ncbi:MAG TPA: IS1595 family transposase [Candidatus Binatia bacterium]
MTYKQLEKRFPTEEACLDYLVSMRWKNGVVCPRCDNAKVYALAKPYRWVCKACAKNGYRFSPLAGTIFENTNIKLRTWFQVIFYMSQSKKGMSALQVHRMIGTGSYRSAWYMCHRIRAAMQDPTFRRLAGVVEVDETYVGGDDRNRHMGKKKGRGAKTAVIGAIARKGNVVCKVIEETDKKTMQDFVKRTVSPKVSLIASDDHTNYSQLDRLGFQHESVVHSRGEYVRGVVHTSNLDSFWSLVKRGIVGSFHNVSKEYLPLYLNEFSFRHNHRDDAMIFDKIVAGC